MMFDYKCKACGHELEADQKISEKPLRKCPKCGKFQLARQISGGGFILSGLQWESKEGY